MRTKRVNSNQPVTLRSCTPVHAGKRIVRTGCPHRDNPWSAHELRDHPFQPCCQIPRKE